MLTDEVPEEIREMARQIADNAFEMAKAEFSASVAKKDLLGKIENAFLDIYEAFAEIMAVLIPPGSLREGFVLVLTENDSLTVQRMLDIILNRSGAVKQFMAEWDGIKKAGSILDPQGVNDLIESVEMYVEHVNRFFAKEPWFVKSQGENDNVYRKTQEAYKEFMDAVSEFFKRTDKEAETVPGIMKAPKVANLLDPNVLKA